MWASITNSKMSLEAKRQAQRELELFGDAYRNAMKAADQRMHEIETTTDTKNGAVAREPKSHREALIEERKAQMEKEESKTYFSLSPTKRSNLEKIILDIGQNVKIKKMPGIKK